MSISGAVKGRQKEDSSLPGKLDERLDEFDMYVSNLKSQLVERDEEIDQLAYALMCREHVLWISDTGRAKSMMADLALNSITGGKMFSIQCSKFMSEEYMFGPVSLRKMRENDKYEHNVAGMLPEAHFAFLDEIGDCNDNLMRSLLGVFNERVFKRGPQQIQCPLWTAVLTSNFGMDRDVLKAFLDRIVFKAELKPISKAQSRIQLYNMVLDKKQKPTIDSIDLSVIETLHEALDDVRIPGHVLSLFDSLIEMYAKERAVPISDRRRVKLLSIIRASALRNRRMTAEPEDCNALRYGLYVINDEKSETTFSNCNEKVMQNIQKTQELHKELETMRVGWEKKLKPMFMAHLSGKKKDDIKSAIEKLEEDVKGGFMEAKEDNSKNGEIADGYAALIKDAESVKRQLEKHLESL